MKTTSLIAAMLAAAAAHVSATGIGVNVGTTGLGADYGFDIIPTFSGRVGISGFDYNHDVNKTNVSYHGRAKLQDLRLLLDWSPLGPFRVTGGVYGAHNRFDLTGQPTSGTYTINGDAYRASDIGYINGQIKQAHSIAPYVGVGYGSVAGAGINFYADFGAFFQGASASVNASCAASSSTCNSSRLAQDVAAEQRHLQDSVSSFKAWPVASIGITVGF